jgi:hypothetical protein
MSALRDWLNANTNVGYKAALIRPFRPMYRQAVIQILNLQGTRLEQFVTDTMARNSREIYETFSKARNSQEANDAIARFVIDNGAKLKSDFAEYTTLNRDATVDDAESTRVVTGLQLRQRFKLPGVDTLAEPTDQTVQDVVQSDLFKWQTTNPETGLFNSVHLDNKRNEYINSREPGMPRPPDRLESLILPFAVLPQYEGEQDVVGTLTDMAIDEVVSAVLQAGPQHSFALYDQAPSIDPSGVAATKNSFMINVNSLQPGFRRDFTQGVLPGQMDAVGMRSIYATYRDPLQRETPIHVTPMSAEATLENINMNGFDYLF